ncbi:hypothetical protein [Xenophilus sp. Marseille-Q4582]|uniref:hypothetical protein n=1 Tax=Xenophilus sp. Marseille-Q4582 TaxID=2866600 RepID=UPI001CE43B3E|nr:hypothetical protein [Xenophilus sp. Marseille-Q4582]
MVIPVRAPFGLIIANAFVVLIARNARKAGRAAPPSQPGHAFAVLATAWQT